MVDGSDAYSDSSFIDTKRASQHFYWHMHTVATHGGRLQTRVKNTCQIQMAQKSARLISSTTAVHHLHASKKPLIPTMTIINTVEQTPLEDEVYLGEEGTDTTLGSDEPGSAVARGSYTVPNGVAVEPLKNYGGHKDLQNTCPDDVRHLLETKGLFDVYDKFVQAIVDTKNTRGSLLGKWKDAQFISVLDLFRDEFTDKGVRVALCKRKSGKGTYRWLEFIDVDAVGDTYEPQYDVANRSGQVVKTAYSRLQFPNGVAVEELKQWGGRRKLKEKIPVHVEKMLTEHGLMKEYDQMVDHVIEAGAGSFLKGSWDMNKLKVSAACC